MRRNVWIALGGGAAVIAAVVLYDALVVSDEERLERFVDDVAGQVTEGAIAEGRARWVDLDRQPFELHVFGRPALYRAGEDAALDERAREAARLLDGSRLRVLTSGIVIEGDRATVTMRVLDDRNGMSSLDGSFRKHGDDWLLERLAIRR